MRRADLLTIGIVAAVIVLAVVPAQAATPSPSEYFTVEEIARADNYNRLRRMLTLSDMALELVVIAALGIGNGAWALGRWARRRAKDRWIPTALIVVAVVTMLPWAVTLPLTLARHRHDRLYDLATNSVPELMRDAAVGLLFSLVIAGIAAIGVVAIARMAKRLWPVVLGAAGAAFLALIVFVFPLVYEPAFNTFTPVDAQTRTVVLDLADRAGVEVSDVLVADASRRTSRRNAYVSGLGSSRRVVLYDTLLRESSPDDVRLVVAHELAHQKHRDVRNGTILGIGGLWLGLAVLWAMLRVRRVRAVAGASHPSDPALLPFLAFFVAIAATISLPVNNAISRSVEARADRTAIELTGDADAAVRLEVNLARDNIADLSPPPFVRWLLATHPPAMERIEAALEAR